MTVLSPCPSLTVSPTLNHILRASLVTHLVKNPPAMQETLVQFLDQEDPLEKGQAAHSTILGFPWWHRWQRIHLHWGRPGFDPWVRKIPWRRLWQPIPVFLPGESPWTEKPGGLQYMGLQRVGHNWGTNTFFNIVESYLSFCDWLAFMPDYFIMYINYIVCLCFCLFVFKFLFKYSWFT